MPERDSSSPTSLVPSWRACPTTSRPPSPSPSSPAGAWAHVDFHSGWLRLEPGETKNAEGRQVAGHLSCDPGQKVQMPSAKLWPSDHSGSIRSLAHGL